MPREGQWVHTNLAGLANGERDSGEEVAPQRNKKKRTTDGASERNENGQQQPGGGGRGAQARKRQRPSRAREKCLNLADVIEVLRNEY